MLLFELMSGLKVKFNKHLLVRINIHQRWLLEAANILNCKLGPTPFKYLSLPIGANLNRRDMWHPVIGAMRSRLSSWRNKQLSIGGRVVMIKSVLSALSVYNLHYLVVKIFGN